MAEDDFSGRQVNGEPTDSPRRAQVNDRSIITGVQMYSLRDHDLDMWPLSNARKYVRKSATRPVLSNPSQKGQRRGIGQQARYIACSNLLVVQASNCLRNGQHKPEIRIWAAPTLLVGDKARNTRCKQGGSELEPL